MTHPFDNNDAASVAPATASATEDAFFVLRDTRALLEQRLGELATRAGVGSKAVVEAFSRAVGDAHDELANDKQRDGFESTEGLTASRITLMCDADLELDIRIKEIARRLADLAGNALWRAQLRYMSLLQRPAMSPENNPVGPEAISSGLWALCNASGAALDRQMELLDRLEQLLASELPAVYDELNDLLASRNVEPAQSTITQSPGPRVGSSPAGGSSQAGSGGTGGGDPFAALQQVLSAQFGGIAAGATGGAAGGAGINMTPTAAAVGSGSANVALNAATLVMLNQLSARLEKMQWGTAAPGEGMGGNAISVATGSASGTSNLDALATAGSASGGSPGEAMPAEGIPKAIKAADLDLPLGNPESIALETLGYIFEAIFETWDLPDTVKTAIGRLQIPLLKLSLFDQALFSNNQHPARQLINAMGRAAIGLPRDIGRADPVSRRLWKIAGLVQETLQGDASVLSEPLEQIQTLIAERDTVIREMGAPFVTYLAAIDQQALGAESVQRWLADVSQQPSAQEIHDFLRVHWVRVMEAAVREGGETGEAWQDARAAAADLIWSVQPKVDADERKRLATLVATLIRRVNAGLDKIGVTLEERAPFLDTCFTLQTASLRGTPPPMVTADATGADSPSTSGAAATVLPVTEVTIDSHTLHIMGRTDGGAPAYRTASSALQAGQWLQTSLADGDPLTGLVVWISPKNGTVLLCNPDWGYSLALTAEAIDLQRRQGKLAVLSNRAIFDEAADRAFRQLSAAT